MILETKRLILREMQPGDFHALYAVLADSDIMQHYPYTFDETRVKNWIAKNTERCSVFGFALFSVCLKESGKMIGDCGLTMQNINGKILPELGWHIAKMYQRNGYAKEAALAWLKFAFESTPFQAVYSYMKTKSIASAATAKSVGMCFLEEFTDAEGEKTSVYALTRAEWEARQPFSGTYHKI